MNFKISIALILLTFLAVLYFIGKSSSESKENHISDTMQLIESGYESTLDSIQKRINDSIAQYPAKPSFDDLTVCYNAKKLALNYIKNPLEANLDDDCAVQWDYAGSYYTIVGSGSTKTDFGVRKRFKFLMILTYNSNDDMWHSKSCDIIPID